MLNRQDKTTDLNCSFCENDWYNSKSVDPLFPIKQVFYLNEIKDLSFLMMYLIMYTKFTILSNPHNIDKYSLMQT